MSAVYDPIEITRLYVFGTSTPSIDDYNAHIRPTGEPPTPITYNMLDYMTNGGGRYALSSLFDAVEKFFDVNTFIPDGIYSYRKITGQANEGDPQYLVAGQGLKVDISQYGTDIGSADFADRAYIFGSTKFTLNLENATFKVVNGVRTIEGMVIKAENDNFDFNSSSLIATVLP